MILIPLATEWELIACLEKIWKSEDNRGRSPFQTCAPFCLELEAPEDVTGSFIFSGLLKIACTASDAAFKSKRFISGVCELHFLGSDALV